MVKGHPPDLVPLREVYERFGREHFKSIWTGKEIFSSSDGLSEDYIGQAREWLCVTSIAGANGTAQLYER